MANKSGVPKFALLRIIKTKYLSNQIVHTKNADTTAGISSEKLGVSLIMYKYLQDSHRKKFRMVFLKKLTSICEPRKNVFSLRFLYYNGLFCNINAMFLNAYKFSKL